MLFTGYTSPDSVVVMLFTEAQGSLSVLCWTLLTGQQSPTSSPAMLRRMMNRAPPEHRRSFPNSSRNQQLLEDYYDGYGSSSTAGGSTSGYGSGGQMGVSGYRLLMSDAGL